MLWRHRNAYRTGENLMSTLQPLQFYFMHFMPYPDVAPGRPQGQWVDIPNRRFDPKIGHKRYKEYIDELVLADKLGYDGLVVNVKIGVGTVSNHCGSRVLISRQATRELTRSAVRATRASGAHTVSVDRSAEVKRL